jgi:hypothetical protein
MPLLTSSHFNNILWKTQLIALIRQACIYIYILSCQTKNSDHILHKVKHSKRVRNKVQCADCKQAHKHNSIVGEH